MKLTYDILWFDDQFEALSPTIARLEQFIRDEGLIPVIEKKDGISEGEIRILAERLDKCNPYDLVIFDFDMGDKSLDGIGIAKELRTNIYTDMVFYSGQKPDEISRMVYEKNIQGVFVVHKTNLINDVEPIIQDQIKKISSLNGARGLIMSEFSQIDLSLREKIIRTIKELSEDKQKEHTDELKRRLSEKLKKRGEDIDSIAIEEVIGNTILMDSDVLRKTCKDIYTSTVFNEGGKFHKTQQERNFLAHNPHEVLENGDISVKGIRKELVYNNEEFSRVRKELIELKSLLKDIDGK